MKALKHSVPVPALPGICDFPALSAMPSLEGDFLPELHAGFWLRHQTRVFDETMSSKEVKPDDDVGSKGHKYR